MHKHLALALLLASCGKSDPTPPAKTEAKTETKTDKPAEKPVEKPAEKPAQPAEKKMTPVKIDPEIASRVKAIVDNCTVDVEYANVSSCKNNEDYAIPDYAASKQLVGVYESLGEIALTDGAKDKKVFAAVVATWNTFNDRELQKKASTPAAAERVLALFPQVPPGCDRFGYAAPVALGAGKRAELVAVLDKLPADSALRRSAVMYFLDYGGAAALPDVQAAYAGAKNDDMRYSAAWSVGVAVYHTVPEPDRTKMCDWSKSLAADTATTDRALGGALASLERCGGTYIDDALAAVEARLATGKLTEATANGLYHACWAEGVVGGSPNGSPAQCERALTMLLKGAASDAPTEPRRIATYAIGAVGQMAKLQAKAKPALTALSTDKDKTVADAAKYALKDLK